MQIGIIQGSLNPDSKTALVVESCVQKLQERSLSYSIIDLRELELPQCDGRAFVDYPQDIVSPILTKLNRCTHFLIGMPVYQYTFSGALKNFLDLFVEGFKNKPFGIIENSGSIRSYLAAGELMQSLFFEVSAIPVPPIVHTWDGDFEDDSIKNAHVFDKLDALLDRLVSIDAE